MQAICRKTLAAITGITADIGLVTVASNVKFFPGATVWLSIGNTKEKFKIAKLVGATGIQLNQLTNYGRAVVDDYDPTNEAIAELDLATLGAGNDDTVVDAIVPGYAGNFITVELVGDSVAGVTIDEVGYAVTIHYESGVSTVGDIETAIGADATLIQVKTAGTGATVLTAPGDDGGPANLSGGTTSQIFQEQQLVPVDDD